MSRANHRALPLIALVPVLAVLSACYRPPVEAAPPPVPPLKVLTFNIRYGTAEDVENHWDRRKELVFDVLRRSGSDVIALQEALRFQLDAIHAAAPGYGEIGVGRVDGQAEGEYSAILYRQDRFSPEESGTFWLSESPAAPGSTTWGNRIPRITTWVRLLDQQTGEPLYVFNTHLDHESQPSREKGIELIMQRIQEQVGSDPVLLVGDFNAGESNPAVAVLTRRTESPPTAPLLIDTFRAKHPDQQDVATYHAFRGTRAGEKIDYIFASRDFDVLDAAIIYDELNGRYPSDHYPVMAVLRVSAP